MSPDRHVEPVAGRGRISTAWSAWSAALLFVAAAVTGCQTSDVDRALNVGEAGGAQVVTEVIGSGETLVLMKLPRGGGVSPSAVRNGAVTAYRALAENSLTLVLADRADDQAVQTAIADKKVRLIVSASAPGNAAKAGAEDAAIVVLTGNDAPKPDGAFAFAATDADSLAAGLRHAAAQRSGTAIFLVPADANDAVVSSVVALAGADLSVRRYSSGQSAALIVANLTSSGSLPAAVGFLSSSAEIVAIAAELIAVAGQDDPPILVGHTGWSEALFARPELNRAIVARLDSSSVAIAAERYRQEFGAAPTIEALYGFDLVAVAAGIARSRGPEALNRATLLSEAGFRGALGSFRFRSDGRVERLHEITIVQGGKLEPIQSAAPGF